MNPSIEDVVKNSMRKKKINELAKSIKRKYLALKLGKSEEDDSLHKLFKPISTPLKEIVHTSQNLNKTFSELKPFVIKKEEDEDLKKEEKIGEDKSSSSRQTSFQTLKDVTLTSGDEYEDLDDEMLDRDESQQQLENISTDAIAEYLEQYPPISQKYVTQHWSQDSEIDKNYGPVYDASNSSWLLGQKRIDFDQRTGNIIIDGLQFKGTPGLYQLVFYSDPSFNDEDKTQYKQILELTNAHKDAIGRLKGSSSQKYHNIIRPLFYKPSHQTKPPFYNSTAKRLGSGLTNPQNLIYNNKPMEYVYWDDPNELVDRLKLLVASRDAGNTSHENEIVAIINELREEKIIL